MISNKVDFLPSPNFNMRDKRHIELVILHATAGSFQSAVDWLRNGDRKNRTSAHYVVSKTGDVVQLVQEKDIAWHAGYGTWGGRGNINQRSIGIELENDNDGKDTYPSELLQATFSLCVRIGKKHGLQAEDFISHQDVDPGRKTDPAGFPWDEFRMSLRMNLG